MARRSIVGKKNIKLKHYEEVYTTKNWIVRLFRVKDFPNREIGLKSRFNYNTNEDFEVAISSPNYKFIN